MTTMTPVQLFFEAMGFEPEMIVSRNTGVFLQYLKEFCDRFNLYWCIESGSDCQYSVYISTDDWSLLMENDILIDAIIMGIASSWSNCFHLRQAKVINLNEWRNRGSQ